MATNSPAEPTTDDPETPENNDATPTGGSAADTMSSGRWTALFVVSVVILVAFGILMLYMLAIANDKGTDEKIWGRQTFIFGAAEAIAFTAIGWMFGREVNRQRAETAEAQAKTETNNARNAEADAAAKSAESAAAKTKADALAKAVVASADNAGSAVAGEVEGAGLRTSNSQLESLRALAVALVPESANG
jgi:hypothetical protein